MLKSAMVRGLLALVFLAALVSNAQAAAKIGVTAAVKNDVRRIVASGAQPLSVGSDLFTNERIRTGEASAAQILLLDKTTLTIGPSAELTLDRFVYNPSKGTGQVVLNAVQGALRFVTGSQNPRNYTIKTPVGTIGIRGTIVDLIIANGEVTVILVQGLLSTTVNGKVYTLDKPGTAYKFSARGEPQGPVAWDGTIMNTAGDVSFPLYGWYFQGEPLNNGLPDVNIGGIDQLNAIIQHSLSPPPPPTTGN
jgi:FecR-like protein